MKEWFLRNAVLLVILLLVVIILLRYSPPALPPLLIERDTERTLQRVDSLQRLVVDLTKRTYVDSIRIARSKVSFDSLLAAEQQIPARVNRLPASTLQRRFTEIYQ